MIETRPYFLIGDLVASAGVGALAASAAAWLGFGTWPMVPAMLVGMVIGMLIGLVAALAGFSLLFGAMEIFVPCMLGGMFAGMAGAMGPIAGLPPAVTGALIGLVTLIFVYVANALLSGNRRVKE